MEVWRTVTQPRRHIGFVFIGASPPTHARRGRGHKCVRWKGGRGPDLAELRSTLARIDPQPPIEVPIGLAMALVEVERDAIGRIAEALLHRGRLSGTEVLELMRG